MTRGNAANSSGEVGRASRALEPVPFGPYTLVGRLGVGGAATVFLATSRDEKRTVVIKRLHEHLNDDPASRSTFLDEARILSKLDHPGIVSVIDIGEVDGRAYFAMPFLEGRDLAYLAARIAGSGRTLPARIAARLVADALAALDYAHEFVDERGERWNLVHRDISPQNLFVSESGQVRLLDFGIAKATMRSTHTRTGVVKGTFAYIAPEQARGLPIDRRADLWSMGVVLWELVAGERLFAATNEFATLSGATTGPVPRLADALPGVPRELDEIAARALLRDVDRRYPTAAAMRDDLLAYLDANPASTDDVRVFLEPYFRDHSGRFDLLLTAERTPSSVSGSRLVELRRARRLTRPLGLALLAVFAVVTTIAFGLPRRPRASHSSPGDSASPTPTRPDVTDAPPEAEARGAFGPRDTPSIPNEETPPASPSNEPSPRPARPAVPPRAGQAQTPEPVATESSPAPAPPPAVDATLSLVSVPWANVTLDGRDVGTTPILRRAIAPGPHDLVLENPEIGVRRAMRVDASPGEALRLHIRLTP